MKTEQDVLKMFDEFDNKHGVDRTPNYTVKIGNKYVKSLDYSKEEGWTYETSDEPVWMSKINAECVITDVIEFIDSIPNENEVTFEVKKMKTINEILETKNDGTTLAELLEQVAEKVKKDVAQVYIMLARQFDDEKLARDIAEKFGIDLESIE